MKQVGDVVFQLRMKRGLTQRELSRLVSVPQPNLSNIEKGKQDVTVGTLQRIASVLNCSLADFFREVEKTPEVVPLSRERIEKLAEAIVKGHPKLTGEDREIAKLFGDLRPHSAAQARLGRTYKAWRQLRAILPKQAINSLHARVRDAEMRQKEKKTNE